MNTTHFHIPNKARHKAKSLIISSGLMISALLYSHNSLAQSYFNASPKHEVRAMWLTTIGGLDWPHTYATSQYSRKKQQEELIAILDKLSKAGINTVLLQTRVRATTIYPSKYEPWDGCLSGVPGKSPDYDALQFAIDECHKRGMELHAWVVTLPVGVWNGKGCADLRKRKPGLIKQIDGHGYMNPEDPRTASYIADICEEITRNYDIDGIHLDYIRYPETWKLKVSKERGREYINDIVKAIHHKVKSLKPWVKMSCSPIGKFNDLSRYWSHGWNAYDKVCQDAQGWLKTGLMDELYPMMYFKDNNFYPFALDWKENDYGKIIAPGLGIYFMSPKEKDWSLTTITQEMEMLRRDGMGHTYFRSKFFTDNTKGIYDFATRFDATPALVPPMTWASNNRPLSPESISINGDQLTWSNARATNDSPTLLYNIYASRECPVDIADARNLIKSRHNGTSLKIDPQYNYAVTAIDRYGNESNAIQSNSGCKEQAGTKESLLVCDGKNVFFNLNERNIDAGSVVICTMQGSMIEARNIQKPREGKDFSAYIGNIEDGFYQLRTIAPKGISHKLGYFIIDRKGIIRAE